MTAPADCIDEFVDDPEMIAMFVNNAAELTEQIENDLVAIERIPPQERLDVVNRIFRAAHTIKGESGFIGLRNIGRLAHGMENILDQVRESRIEPTQQVVSTLLSSLDTLRQMIESVEDSHSVDVGPHLSQLALLESGTQPIPLTPSPSPVALAKAEAMSSNQDGPVAKASSNTARARVLIVDDEPTVVAIASRQLNKAGIPVDEAINAEDALQMMRRNLYTVVICDINLPGISGVELLRKLKTLSPMVQVVMLTGHTNIITVLDSFEAGAADFLPKSQDYTQLVKLVNDALGRVDRWVPLMRSRK